MTNAPGGTHLLGWSFHSLLETTSTYALDKGRARAARIEPQLSNEAAQQRTEREYTSPHQVSHTQCHPHLAVLETPVCFVNVLGCPQSFQQVRSIELNGSHRHELLNIDTATFDHRAERPKPENSMISSTAPADSEVGAREGGSAVLLMVGRLHQVLPPPVDGSPPLHKVGCPGQSAY